MPKNYARRVIATGQLVRYFSADTIIINIVYSIAKSFPLASVRHTSLSFDRKPFHNLSFLFGIAFVFLKCLGINVAYRKPVNQSSTTRAGPAALANDGQLGNENPDEQKCSETQKEPSPWWRVDLLMPQTVRVVRITTRGCCGNTPLQDLEIRVGNSSFDLQRNPLCAWYPGTVGKCVCVFGD